MRLNALRTALASLALFSTIAYAQPLPNPPSEGDPSLISILLPWLSTAMAQLNNLKRSDYRAHEHEFVLSDGSRVGGLFFDRPDSDRILICTLGFNADIWSGTDSEVVTELVGYDLINAKVLVLDHPISAGFYGRNGYLSLGGWDEGQMLLEIVPQALGLAPGINHVHFLGVSMGANGVINAILEEQRRGTHMIDSAITFSAVTDFSEVPARQLAVFGKDNPWASIAKTKDPEPLFTKYAMNLTNKRYMQIASELGHPVRIPLQDFGKFYYRGFENRLSMITAHAPQWVDASSVDHYIRSTNLYPQLDDIRRPLIMVHAQDDVIVPYTQHEEVLRRTASNPWVLTHHTRRGGHWAFTVAYGREWVAQMIDRVFHLDPSSFQ